MSFWIDNKFYSNNQYHETHDAMKPLTPRNLWNYEAIDTTTPLTLDSMILPLHYIDIGIY